MSATVTFNCFIKAQDTDWETFEFRMSDIYVGELNKWLKADSMDDAKAFFNLEILKTVQSFSFYTTSQGKARWSLQENVTLKDFFDYKKPGHAFKLKIIALASNHGAIIECRDCQPVSSMLTPTPVGTMQAYTLKYVDVKYEKFAAYRQHNR